MSPESVGPPPPREPTNSSPVPDHGRRGSVIPVPPPTPRSRSVAGSSLRGSIYLTEKQFEEQVFPPRSRMGRWKLWGLRGCPHLTGRVLAGSLCCIFRGSQSLHHRLASYWERRESDTAVCWSGGVGSSGPGLDPGHRSGGQVGEYLLKPGLMRDSPGHRLLVPSPGPPL